MLPLNQMNGENTMRHLKYLILIFFCLAGSLSAQSRTPRQFLYLDDWTYDLVEYWINNSSLTVPFVLNQPYSIADIEKNLKLDNNWTRLQKRYYQRFFGQPGFGKVIIYARDNYSFVTDPDMPKRKALQQAPVDDVYLFDNATKNHANFSGQFNLMLPHISLVNRTMINSEYKDDPLFFGDTGEWIFGKINDAYLNVNLSSFDLFIGRMDRNWGSLSSPGLILSNNPYSYDHAQVSYTSKHFKFSMIVTRLEDLLAVDSQGAFPDSLMLSRKYMTAHRFEFSISPKLQFAATEIAIYGGPDRDFEFSFLNPMNYFYLIQRNNNQQISGLWALDVFYKPASKVNTFFQLLLDDIIVNNEPGQDDRARIPDRLGVTLKLSAADLMTKGLQSAIEYTRIWNRTYQSFRTYENFQYRGKGLGYPTASIARIGLNVKYFNLFPAIIKFSTYYQRSGDIRLTDVFTGEKENFLVGIVEKLWNLNLEFSYFPNLWSRLTARLGYEKFGNYRHVKDDNRSNFKLILGLHVNLAIALKVD